MYLDDIHIVDELDRTLLVVNSNGEVAIGRFPDLSEGLKNMIVELYIDATGEDAEVVKSFLEYKSDKNEFCS